MDRRFLADLAKEFGRKLPMGDCRWWRYSGTAG